MQSITCMSCEIIILLSRTNHIFSAILPRVFCRKHLVFPLHEMSHNIRVHASMFDINFGFFFFITFLNLSELSVFIYLKHIF